MGLSRIFWIIIILFASVAMIISFLSPSIESYPVSTTLAVQVMPPVQVYHDDLNNVTCWYTSRGNSSIHCIPDADLSPQITNASPTSNLSFSEVESYEEK